jgi:predicted CoA-substrate-specific enzyme activase
LEVFIGVDVGSVSTNVAVLDACGEVIDTVYLRTQGRPIYAIQQALKQVRDRRGDINVAGIGTTGSGRQLAGVVIGADAIKNEITAHAVAAMHIVPDVKTILEIGGQDSKIILIRDRVVTDFAMNTVCAAGTGSFLDQQASRLNIPIQEFGSRALQSVSPVRVAGRCAVFAESDMIHKQQTGHQIADILNGLCQALVRNYLNNVGKGKHIESPVVFQGGVAANTGMKRAFEAALGCPVLVPAHYDVMGAIGAALLAKERVAGSCTNFRGFDLVDYNYDTGSFECDGCPNICEVVEIKLDQTPLARWGDRCGKWGNSVGKKGC